MGLIDISQPLTKGIPVWPGDTAFDFQLNWTKAASGSVNVGQVTMSTHTGTHIDAPFHFDDQGEQVVDLDLDLYIGRVKVVHLLDKQYIEKADFESVDLRGVTRLLIKTDSWADRDVFPESITYLSPELGPFLAEQGVRLIGLDVPSVDPIDSKELPAHHSLHANGVHILEGAVLDDVDQGDYELVALPLKLSEGDASPVRAVLRTISFSENE